MELTYTKCGDYFIPDLSLPDMSGYQLGKYGRMRKAYLKEHHRGIYEGMILSSKLWTHLAEIDETCNERMERIVSTMAKQEGVTEELKAADQMEWVGRMNSIRNRAEETILSELVYAG
ncbi:MAG: TnpV protein [Christensenellales bacterium]|jgi:hypothetical protein